MALWTEEERTKLLRARYKEDSPFHSSGGVYALRLALEMQLGKQGVDVNDAEAVRAGFERALMAITDTVPVAGDHRPPGSVTDASYVTATAAEG